jgi:hypothetical protein
VRILREIRDELRAIRVLLERAQSGRSIVVKSREQVIRDAMKRGVNVSLREQRK